MSNRVAWYAAVATVLVLVLAAAVAPARAGTVTVSFNGDTAVMDVNLTAKLIEVPKVADELFHAAKLIVDGFKEQVKDMLRKSIMDYIYEKHHVNVTVEVTVVNMWVEEKNETANVTFNSFSVSGGSVVGRAPGELTVSATANTSIVLRFPLVACPDRILNMTAHVYASAPYAAYYWNGSAWVLAANVSSGGWASFATPQPIIMIAPAGAGTVTVRAVLTEAYTAGLVHTHLVLVFHNVSSSAVIGRAYKCWMCDMTPEYKLTVGTSQVPLATILLVNLSNFSVPLSEWNRVYNGTHTIFTLTRNITIYTIVGRIEVDPTAELVVPGYAIVLGDAIVTVEPLPIIAIGAVVAAAVVLAVVLAGRRAAEEVLGRRRFVERL